MNDIDTNFDFTTDTPKFWDNFWNNNDGFGAGSNDPDKKSPTLRNYHQILWSKKLPNGQFMKLKQGNTEKEYLYWDNFRFGSDTLIADFKYKKMKDVLDKLQQALPNYIDFQETFLRKTYTIGGMIIFPKHPNSINQLRGTNPQIKDRIDLTLECIRKYYLNETSPLYDTLKNDKDFFDLFVDFKGYVDFFFLQDLVSDDYSSVIFFIGNGDFNNSPLPCNIDEYMAWYNKSVDFIDKRNKRIEEYLSCR